MDAYFSTCAGKLRDTSRTCQSKIAYKINHINGKKGVKGLLVENG
jgi:hypothetical protein